MATTTAAATATTTATKTGTTAKADGRHRIGASKK